MSRPVVTVLVPAYNQENYIREALRAVQEGVYPLVNIIVIDDGSTDSTVEAVKSFQRDLDDRDKRNLKLLRKENGGKASALNFARPHVRGDYVTILDADDRLPRFSLVKRVDKIMSSRAIPDLVVGGFSVFRGELEMGARSAPASTDHHSLRQSFFLSPRTPFSLNNCLIEREFFMSVGPFDTRLKRCQDIDFAIRMLAQEPEIAVVDESVYEYRKHRVDRADRLKIRTQTAYYRALTYWKNASPGMKVPAVMWGVVMDCLKAAYELNGTYNR